MKEKEELKQADFLDWVDNPKDDVSGWPRQLREWKALAEEGDAQSQYRMGGVYFEGYSVVEKDIQKAIRWFRKAAKQGHHWSQRFLRMCYGVDEWGDWKDVVSAYAWHNIALANHNREHQIVLVGYKYEDKSNEEFQEANENFQDEIDKVITPAQIKKAEAMVKELDQNNPKLIQKKQGSHP